jgi:NAD(P)H dehydrogenase (quinone)
VSRQAATDASNYRGGNVPLLVTGAGGGVGSVGRRVVERLRERALPVRALVHREDERADTLRALGAEVVVGDLTRAPDVVRTLDGCRRAYFGMAVSAQYLEATATFASAGRAHGGLEVVVNMSQMTVSQMDLTSTEESRQQRLHWLAEQVLDWSDLPVTHVRPTMFMENPLWQIFAIESIAQRGTIRLPFGAGRSSPVSAQDVADVVATILVEPAGHVGRTYELTGPRSQDLAAMAEEFSAALGRPVTYEDVTLEEFAEELSAVGLPEHIFNHIVTMARLHGFNRYDRSTQDVETILGRPATGIRDYVEMNAEVFRTPH